MRNEPTRNSLDTTFESFFQSAESIEKFIDKGELNELEEQGLIQAFEYTFELAWNTLKDYFEAQGETDIHGSRDAIRLAFRRGLVEDGETWMDMIASRTLTSHTYNEEIAKKIAKSIQTLYYNEFVKLHARFEALRKEWS